jgi:hypothetical protein
MGSFMEVFRGTKLDGILLLAKVFSEKIISLFPQPYLLVHLFNSLPPSPWCGRGGTQASPVEACPPVSPAVGRHVALLLPLLLRPFPIPFMLCGSPKEALAWGAMPIEVWMVLPRCGLVAT